MLVLARRPVVRDHPHLHCPLRGIGEHGTGVAVRAEVLARVEAGGRDVSQSAGPHAVTAGPLRLGRVFHHPGADPLGQRQQPLHRRRLPVQVNRDDGPGARGHRGGHGIDVDEVAVVVGAVGENRPGPGPAHRLGGRDERVGWQDALVARPDPQPAQRNLDRIGPVRHADALLHAAEVGVFTLKCGHLRAADERGAGQHLLPAGCHLPGDRRMLRLQVDKRNQIHSYPPPKPACLVRCGKADIHHLARCPQPPPQDDPARKTSPYNDIRAAARALQYSHSRMSAAGMAAGFRGHGRSCRIPVIVLRLSRVYYPGASPWPGRLVHRA